MCDFRSEHRVKLHSINDLERLDGEVNHRTDVVGIFPNDECAVQRNPYITPETMADTSDDLPIGLPAMVI